MTEEQFQRLLEIEEKLERATLPCDHRKALSALHEFLEEILQSAKERRARAIIWGIWRNRLTFLGLIGSAIAIFRDEIWGLLEVMFK